LDELGCPRFRLSCRAADWYGSSDAARLAEVTPNRALAVLEIEPLSQEDIAAIVSSRDMDSGRFMAEARTRGVYEVLQNPQTLLMMMDVCLGTTVKY
jgi:hypothetical protein